MTNPSRSASIGRDACAGSSLWPPPRARMRSKAPNASGDSGHSTPPAIAASISPVRIAPIASPIATAPRRARVGGGQDRPADVEGDAEVGRRGPAEDGEREGGGDRSQAARQVLLVLALGERDAAQRRPEVDPDPLAIGRPVHARHEPGVGHRHPAGREAELREPVERRGSPARPCGRPGRSRRPGPRPSTGTGAGSKRSMRFTGEAFARRPARNAGSPIPIAEITPTPVIQTSRGSSRVSHARRPRRRSPRRRRGPRRGRASSPASGRRSGG